MIKLKYIIITLFFVVVIATLIEGYLSKNYIGYLIRNVIEAIILLIGIYIGMMLEKCRKGRGEEQK